MSSSVAAITLHTPISRVRSVTDTSMICITPILTRQSAGGLAKDFEEIHPVLNFLARVAGSDSGMRLVRTA